MHPCHTYLRHLGIRRRKSIFFYFCLLVPFQICYCWVLPHVQRIPSEVILPLVSPLRDGGRGACSSLQGSRRLKAWLLAGSLLVFVLANGLDAPARSTPVRTHWRRARTTYFTRTSTSTASAWRVPASGTLPSWLSPKGTSQTGTILALYLAWIPLRVFVPPSPLLETCTH